GTDSPGGAPDTLLPPSAPARFCLVDRVSHYHRQQAGSRSKQIELPGRKIANVESCVGGLCRIAVAGGGARSIGLEEGMGKNHRGGKEGRPGERLHTRLRNPSRIE